MSYLYNRTGFILCEEGYEDWVHYAENPYIAWRGAFMFDYKTLGDIDYVSV